MNITTFKGKIIGDYLEQVVFTRLVSLMKDAGFIDFELEVSGKSKTLRFPEVKK